MFRKQFFGIALLAVVVLIGSGMAVSAQDDTCTPMLVGNSYMIQAGDTLSGVALHFGVTVEALQAANCLQTNAMLQVGQELVIPPSDPAQLLAQFMYRYCQATDSESFACQWMARHGQFTADEDTVGNGLYTQTRTQSADCTEDCEPLQTRDQLHTHDQAQDCTGDCVPVGDANQNRNTGGKNN